MYNETELTDSVIVQKAIDHDDEVAETYQDLLAAKALLDHTLMRPSLKALQNVLQYAACAQ
jgi:hypothetical protein